MTKCEKWKNYHENYSHCIENQHEQGSLWPQAYLKKAPKEAKDVFWSSSCKINLATFVWLLLLDQLSQQCQESESTHYILWFNITFIGGWFNTHSSE